jgi:hypothetical protein
LVDLAGAAGVSEAFSGALAGLRERRSGHDPGRVRTDVAVMLADGGHAISDLAVLRDQPGLFGEVASTATAWRVLAAVDETALARLRQARAEARERAWLLRAEAGRDLPASTAAGCGSPAWCWMWTPPWWRCTRRRSPPRRTTRAAMGFIRAAGVAGQHQ